MSPWRSDIFRSGRKRLSRTREVRPTLPSTPMLTWTVTGIPTGALTGSRIGSHRMGSAVPSYDLGSGEVTHQQCMDIREATGPDLNQVEAGSPACLGCHRRRRRRLAQVFLAVDLNRGEEDGEEDRPEEESDQPVGRQAAEDAEEEEQHRQLGLFPDEHRP